MLRVNSTSVPGEPTSMSLEWGTSAVRVATHDSPIGQAALSSRNNSAGGPGPYDAHPSVPSHSNCGAEASPHNDIERSTMPSTIGCEVANAGTRASDRLPSGCVASRNRALSTSIICMSLLYLADSGTLGVTRMFAGSVAPISNTSNLPWPSLIAAVAPMVNPHTSGMPGQPPPVAKVIAAPADG